MLTELQNAIASKINLNNYEATIPGQYIETSLGEFVVISRPNIYQPSDCRVWEFQQTTDADGEPMMDAPIITIKAIS